MNVTKSSLTAGHVGRQGGLPYHHSLPYGQCRVIHHRFCTSTGSSGTQWKRMVVMQASHMSSEVECSRLDDRFSRIKNTLLIGNTEMDRMKSLMELGGSHSSSCSGLKEQNNRVMGCTAQVWLKLEIDSDNKVVIHADSDALVTRGLCAVLTEALTGLSVEELLAVKPESLLSLGLGPESLTRSRTNGFLSMLESAKKQVNILMGGVPLFPSLVVSASSTVPRGAFAESQQKFLEPNTQQMQDLVHVLKKKKIGIVAHFYMDPEVQGVLSAAAAEWPHIKISDSLVMADGAVAMAEAGCTTIAVLGVDFMSENVRAILDEAGHSDVAVYRMAHEDIGCSLAEAAESPAYEKYLETASKTPNSVHVVYINTSLRTKATAHAVVPTITCTSSNVVQTVLQAFAQVPDSHVWYGPDTYMGRNLVQLFESLSEASAEEVAELHPLHTPDTIKSLLPRLHHFQEGTCIVHHLFGGDVCKITEQVYRDAYIAAHFEVPGEMFTLAMEARKRGMGVVGSTQNILDFIAAKVTESLDRPFSERIQVVLGTETGMVTSIVRKVQAMLQNAGREDIEVEIIFPVSPDSVTILGESSKLPGGIPIVPGPAGGEGCSQEGGCASCPYMKMNSLSALMDVCNKVSTESEAIQLAPWKPRPYEERIDGKTMAQAGCIPILHMRSFQKTGKLSEDLERDMITRNSQ
jgi:quinolinate synthase